MKSQARPSQITDRLAVLSEMSRIRLMRLLEQHELSVGEMSMILQMPQSTVSRHLKVLFEGGWTERRTAGTAGHYYVNLDDLDEDSRTLWVLTRQQLGEPPQIRQDQNRLQQALAERRTDSREYFGRVGAEWDDVRAELFGRQFTDQAIAALLPSDWTVVDLGCGTGNLAARLAPYIHHLHVVDCSPEMLKAAAARLNDLNNISFHEANLTNLPLRDASADAVLISLVLHHIEDPACALTEAWRILRPGGRLLIIDMFEHDRSEYRHTMGHRWPGFSKKQLTRWLTDAGFQNVQIRPLPADPDTRGPELLTASAIRSK